MTPVKNKLSTIANASQYLPEKIRNQLISKVFGRVVPYVGTSGLVYDKVTPNQVIVSIANKRAIQNHIGQVHAVAMALIAETATGFVTALNVPDDRIVLIKTLNIDYKKPSKGNMQATATLTDEQRQYILEHEKGELQIPVKITDDTGNEPISTTMIWAWLPKSTLKNKH